MIVAPDNSKIKVLAKGTSQGLKGWIPLGGHIAPSSTVGAKAEWKKAQKKPKKNITSDIIKRNIPKRKPF